MSVDLNQVLAGKTTVAIGGHVRPDGDCVGSCLGMYDFLTEQYPSIQVDLYLEPVMDCYEILQNVGVIRSEIDPNVIYDLFICLDCGDEERLGFSQPLMAQAKHTACIDHHVSNEAFADDNEIDPDASSTSELLYRLFGKERISFPCAEALYMGIAHDTGVFQYSCTSPETMEAAAELMRKGINGSRIIEKTYYEKTYTQEQILGKALTESRLVMDGKCIISCLSADMLLQYHAENGDLDGIVSQLRQTKGVEVSFFLHEVEPDSFKVSLRSEENVDVSVIAQYFGGGGHKRAAGFSIQGTADEVIQKVCDQIEKQI